MSACESVSFVVVGAGMETSEAPSGGLVADVCCCFGGVKSLVSAVGDFWGVSCPRGDVFRERSLQYLRDRRDTRRGGVIAWAKPSFESSSSLCAAAGGDLTRTGVNITGDFFGSVLALDDGDVTGVFVSNFSADLDTCSISFVARTSVVIASANMSSIDSFKAAFLGLSCG